VTTTVLYALAAFASAFLIFLVQPMVGKRILPWFGGGPGVWTLCLMFYQTTLFLGYAYAHTLIRRTSPRAQLAIHGLVFAGAVLLLPVVPDDHWRPAGLDDPERSILLMLFANVALPFLALAATGPLVQAWFARQHPDRSPYPLYAVSNVGSLLALCAYPFVIEPRLGLSVTSTGWGVAFVVSGVAVLTCGFLARAPGSKESASEDSASTISTPLVLALWVLLPAAAVIVLMAITNRLCLDLASVPFLWVLPLGIYLLSFVFCFGSERAYRRTPFVLFTLLALLATVAGPLLAGLPGSRIAALGSIYGQIATHSLLLFGVSMVLHGELYRLRPPAQKLTSFYLCVSGGGALGGVFVGVVAPRVFDAYHEFPLGLGCAGVLLMLACGVDTRSILHFGAPRWRWALVAPAALAGLVVIALVAVRQPEEMIHGERNFFGVLRVYEKRADDPQTTYNSLTHGNTLHGVQFLHPEMRKIPTRYFGRGTGIAAALASRPSDVPTHVGIVGLGAGTLAAYGRKGDRFRFYELDPDVIRLAMNKTFFSYLSDSAAKIALVPGDARLSLRAELGAGNPQKFDVLVLDAFSSDSIPVHLLTLEAFALFAEHLRQGGLIAAHVSNRHLELAPLVMRMGQRLGMQAVFVINRHLPRLRTSAARWVLLSRDTERLRSVRSYVARLRESQGLKPEAIIVQAPESEVLDRAPVWTDDFSDIYSVLKPIARESAGG
jgi:spermidine synthase